MHVLAALAARQVGQQERQLDVLEGGQHRDQVVELEDEPDVVGAPAGDPRVGECPRGPRRGRSPGPASRRSSPAIRFSRVVLPEPEGPIRARNSPSSTRQVEVDEHRDPELVAAVFLGHSLEHDRMRHAHVTFLAPEVGGRLLDRPRSLVGAYRGTVASVFDGFRTTPRRPSDPDSTRARSALVTATSTGRFRTVDRSSTTQAYSWPFSSNSAALGTNRNDRLASGLFERLVGEEVDGGHQLGEELLVGVEDLDLHLDRPPGAVPHRDDLAEPAMIAPARHGADGDLGRLVERHPRRAGFRRCRSRPPSSRGSPARRPPSG